MDITDRKLLNLIQTDFSFIPEPFEDLARRLDTSTDEVIRRIGKLKERNVIRMIGPVLDSRSLGYHSTLVAMEVPGTELEKTERIIAAHPGVSHGYERNYRYNVWFTLVLPPVASVDAELKRLKLATGALAAFSLPAIKVFKIGAYFDMDDEGNDVQVNRHKSPNFKRVDLSVTDKIIINELQQDLALIPSPFSAMALKTGMDLDSFLSGCRSLQQRGVIRRFSASIAHRNAGFTANAMTCWSVPPEETDAAGQKLASLKEVSHCYLRQTNRIWRYNLFAMVHGKSRELCLKIAEKVSGETGLKDYSLLFSTKEFKKTRVKYVV